MKKLRMRTIYFLDNLGFSIVNVKEIAFSISILKAITTKVIEVVFALYKESRREISLFDFSPMESKYFMRMGVPRQED